MSEAQQICVIIDGYCNHADYEIEHEEIDDYNPVGPDSSYTVRIRVCTKCHAYRRDEYDDNEWQGVTAWPMIS